MAQDSGRSTLDSAAALHRSGRLDEAARRYADWLRRHPDDPQALTPLGVIALQRGDAQRAAELLRQSVSLRPDQPQALAMQAIAEQRVGRLDSALACFDRAVALRPGDADLHNNRGVVLRQLQRLDEAIASYDRALALQPALPQAHNNRGNALQDLRRLDEAMASFDQAIVLRPQYAEAWWNKARLLILRGDYAAGWQMTEWRWQGPQRDRLRRFTQTLWLGDRPIEGRTILVHAEQGLGDCIQFCRYVPLLAARAARVVLEAPSTLVPLLRTLGADCVVVPQGQALPPFDLHCPVMSLPAAFRTTLADVPASVPYLHADPGRRARWRERLGASSRRRIGLVWSGSAAQAEDSRRSIPLETLAPLLDLPCDFHALQTELRPVDAETARRMPNLTLHGPELGDFADTAALVAEMDLVISVCTSVAHLAGALARPLWVMLAYMPDYRWLLDRSDSPWYPTARLLRQSQPGAWDAVVGEAVRDLQHEARNGGQQW